MTDLMDKFFRVSYLFGMIALCGVMITIFSLVIDVIPWIGGGIMMVGGVGLILFPLFWKDEGK